MVLANAVSRLVHLLNRKADGAHLNPSNLTPPAGMASKRSNRVFS
jgi:hypothetical protein